MMMKEAISTFHRPNDLLGDQRAKIIADARDVAQPVQRGAHKCLRLKR